jgi:dolichol-phosphate mannosyltransferase
LAVSVRKKITVVTCAYNEGACIGELARRLVAVFDSLPAYDFEVLAVENGSVDNTPECLQAISAADRRFRVVELSRNFGFEGGLSAGLSLADGDAVVLMAADLQDPPEVIPRLIEKWEEGYENVYGMVASREGVDWKRRANSRLFYSLMGRLADEPIPPNARDFRLLDRIVYEQVREMREQRWFLRGLIAWPGFRSVGVDFDQPPRFGGESKATFLPLLEFATKAIFANSLAPLRVIPITGLILVLGSVLALIGLGVSSLANGVALPSFGTLVSLIALLFGVLFCLLGVIGIYVGLIFEQVKARPSFVLRRVTEVGAEALSPSDAVASTPPDATTSVGVNGAGRRDRVPVESSSEELRRSMSNRPARSRTP